MLQMRSFERILQSPTAAQAGPCNPCNLKKSMPSCRHGCSWRSCQAASCRSAFSHRCRCCHQEEGSWWQETIQDAAGCWRRTTAGGGGTTGRSTRKVLLRLGQLLALGCAGDRCASSGALMGTCGKRFRCTCTASLWACLACIVVRGGLDWVAHVPLVRECIAAAWPGSLACRAQTSALWALNQCAPRPLIGLMPCMPCTP
jgi:hypothetical protein